MSSRRARIVLLRNSKYCYNKALATDCRCFVPDQRIRTLGFNSSSPSSAFFGLVAAAGALAAFAALAACLSRCFCLRLSSLEISRVSNLSSFSLKLNVETHDLEIISPVSGSLCKFCSLGWAASGPDIFDGMTSVKERKKAAVKFFVLLHQSKDLRVAPTYPPQGTIVIGLIDSLSNHMLPVCKAYFICSQIFQIRFLNHFSHYCDILSSGAVAASIYCRDQ